MLIFKLYRRNVIGMAMMSLRVVGHLDAAEGITSGLLPVEIDCPADALAFRALEEELGKGVVAAIFPVGSRWHSAHAFSERAANHGSSSKPAIPCILET
jgi:hypothetical protein